MMEKQKNHMEDMINRYVYQVIKHLSSKNRKDIEEELRTLIYDMLDERTQGNLPYYISAHCTPNQNTPSLNPRNLAQLNFKMSHYIEN